MISMTGITFFIQLILLQVALFVVQIIINDSQIFILAD